jgi:hypothetical protein
VLTISRLSRWSINYYNETARDAKQAAMDRRRANGGLGEYYSESDTRTPTWLLAGDFAHTAELVGLDGRAADGGSADPKVLQRWLDDGIAPNGKAGRAFTKTSVHGFDLTFAAPKSVSVRSADRALALRIPMVLNGFAAGNKASTPLNQCRTNVLSQEGVHK